MNAARMQGAIFDMDGLLLDTERLFQRTWREMAAEIGGTLDDSFTAAITGTTGEEEERILLRYLPQVEPKSFITELNRRVRSIEETYVPLKPGAREILEGMGRRGLRLAVASSSPLEMICHNLAVAGIEGCFDVVVSGTEVPHGKPAPDVFLRAAELLELEPGVCWVFEDSRNGIRAGAAAGCRTVMIPDLVPPTEEIRSLCTGVWPDLGTAWRHIQTNMDSIE